MRLGRHTLRGLAPLACALVMAGAAQVFGQEAQELNRVPNGEAVKKFRGVVVKRDADWFTMAPTTGGPQTVVLLTSSTVVQPFGYGQLEPVADNKTRAGRAKNRRAEIRLMANKGITGQTGGQ